MKIRLYMIDDHPLVIDGLRANLDAYAGLELVGWQSDPQKGIDEVNRRRAEIDLVLVDISMPTMNGIEVCRAIKSGGPHPYVAYLTFLVDHSILKQILAGEYDGVIYKSDPVDTMIDFMRRVVAGPRPILPDDLQRYTADETEVKLTRMELIVLYYIAVKGLTSREIAERVGRSELTILKHRKNIMAKLNIHSVQGLVWHAISLKLHLNPPV
ncbi:MAG: hypothetical protein RL594_1016 [Bacteroidota bacterium]|jgi:DNA-binding NarL/FixJ family response regulator